MTSAALAPDGAALNFLQRAQLSADGKARFDRALTRRTLRNGQPLLNEGDACTSLLLVETGALRVFKVGVDGREITLYRVRAGELCILSLAALLARSPYAASVAASGDATAWELDGETFRALHATEPGLQAHVAGQLHRLLSDVMALVSEVAFRRVDERLAAFLLAETTTRDALETTHERLAQHLGTAREVVSRLLENLRDDGVVETGRGVIRVVKRDALAAMVT